MQDPGAGPQAQAQQPPSTTVPVVPHGWSTVPVPAEEVAAREVPITGIPESTAAREVHITGIPESTEYQLKKYLLLLATLVATVTYGAGLNLPGGSWLEDTPGGQLAGDSILRETNYRRYIVFYCFNAISFAASLLLGLLLLVLQKEGSQEYLLLMWTVMLVDGLGLMGAYAAGISHDKFTTICASVLVSSVGVYAAAAFACYLKNHRHLQRLKKILFRSRCGAGNSHQAQNLTRGIQNNATPANTTNDGDDSRKPTEKHEMLLVLAIFAATIAYVAGLNPPGGFWRSTVEGHHTAGDPVLQRLHPNRYKAFFFCNTTAFVTSLLAIMLIVDYEKFNLEDKLTSGVLTLYGLIITSLLGLGGAYAAGSCRDGKHTGYVVALLALVVACMSVVAALQYIISTLCGPLINWLNVNDSKFMRIWNGEDENAKDKSPGNNAYGKLHEYIQLLATLAATIAYLAGLDPPGGVWANSGEGHSVGDPILLTTHPVRYKVFFYFNSAAFVASLVIVVMLQKTNLVRSGHALLAALILDFFGLIGAYAAGRCRDTSTTIYTVSIAGAVLIYVVIHIVFFTLDSESNNEDELERKRELLVLLAVLAATLAYQAGLTPPGGLWEDDDKFGHHRAGFPVLQDKYPRRYKAFFYCNAASFMASVALIILLLNKNMYKPGIRCYALYVCMVAGMFGLIGAYAAGSSLHRRTSTVFLVLVAAGFGIVIWLAFLRYVQHQKKQERSNKDKKDQQSSNKDKDKDDDVERQDKNQDVASSNKQVNKDKDGVEGQAKIKQDEPSSKKDADHMAYYLMLVGILAASITYLTGLKPPGGMWREDGDGHSAGNPVLYDINKRRYNVFFYSNSASFVASIIVIALLLSRMMLPVVPDNFFMRLRRVHTAIVLDVLTLLVAYAAGSSRESRRSWKVIMLFPIEVLVVLLFCFISIIRKAYCLKQEASHSQTQTTPKT